MSEPTWPVYTFKLNLVAARLFGWSLPYNLFPEGNETTSEASNIPNTFTSWIPNLIRSNMGQQLGTAYSPTDPKNGHNGYTFTAYGQKALYLKNTYVSNPPSADDLLILVS